MISRHLSRFQHKKIGGTFGKIPGTSCEALPLIHAAVALLYKVDKLLHLGLYEAVTSIHHGLRL